MSNPDIYLYLIRHGESQINTITGTFGGRQNSSPLTPRGILQAQNLGRFIKDRGIVPTSVHSSPAVRARDTAHHALAAAEIHNLPINETDLLQELDRGDWTGRTRREIEADASVQVAMRQEGMAFKPSADAESMIDGFQRILKHAHSLHDPTYTAERPQHVLAFSHSNIIGCFIAAVTNIERHYTDSIPIGQASMSIFHHTNGHWLIDDVNIDTQIRP